MNEEWKAIECFPGYEVSDQGRIRRGAKIRTPTPTHDGYLRVSFWTEKGARKVAVHSIVAAAFLGPRPDRHAIRHLNGDRADNRAANLSYGTQQENEADKDAHGTKVNGTKHHSNKLTEQDVLSIRARHSAGGAQASLRAIGSAYGVSFKTVQAIVKRETWKHVA